MLHDCKLWFTGDGTDQAKVSQENEVQRSTIFQELGSENWGTRLSYIDHLGR